MKTLQLFTVTTILALFSISTLNAQEVPYDRDHHKHHHNRAQKQDTILQIGDQGWRVKELQRALRAEGFYGGPIDGFFGRGLKRDLKAFQRSYRFYPSGVADYETLRFLRLI